MRIKAILTLFSFLPILLFSQPDKENSVTYEMSSEKITFFDNGTFVIELKSNPTEGLPLLFLRPGDAVISYGRYIKYKNKAYYLFSSPEIISELYLEICEQKIENKDSLTIEIDSPYEEKVMQNPCLRNYFYIISFKYDNDSIKKYKEQKKDNILKQIYYDTPQMVTGNKLTVCYNPDLLPVKSLTIDIYSPYRTNYIVGSSYIWDKNSNYLKINIPEFTGQYYEFFIFKEVKILDKKSIGMGHFVYWKSDVYEKIKNTREKQVYKNKLYRWMQLSYPILVYHQIQKGETLSDIAHKYETTEDAIIELNKFKNGIMPKKGKIRVSYVF